MLYGVALALCIRSCDQLLSVTDAEGVEKVFAEIESGSHDAGVLFSDALDDDLSIHCTCIRRCSSHAGLNDDNLERLRFSKRQYAIDKAKDEVCLPRPSFMCRLKCSMARLQPFQSFWTHCVTN